jgi:hypothetical protein
MKELLPLYLIVERRLVQRQCQKELSCFQGGVGVVSGANGKKLWTFAPDVLPREVQAGTEPNGEPAPYPPTFKATFINDASGDQEPDVLVTIVYDCHYLTGTHFVFRRLYVNSYRNFSQNLITAQFSSTGAIIFSNTEQNLNETFRTR